MKQFYKVYAIRITSINNDEELIATFSGDGECDALSYARSIANNGGYYHTTTVYHGKKCCAKFERRGGK